MQADFTNRRLFVKQGLPARLIQFWRDKQQREVDFVVPTGRDAVDAIECKWSVVAFETRGLAAFRENYPKGQNFLVSPVPATYQRRFGEFTVTITPLTELRAAWSEKGGHPS